MLSYFAPRVAEKLKNTSCRPAPSSAVLSGCRSDDHRLQVHVWPPDRPDRRLGDGAGDRKPYGYEALVADMDRAGVDRAILVPPSFDHDRNDYAPRPCACIPTVSRSWAACRYAPAVTISSSDGARSPACWACG